MKKKFFDADWVLNVIVTAQCQSVIRVRVTGAFTIRRKRNVGLSNFWESLNIWLKTFRPDKLTNAAIKMSSFSIVTSMLYRLTLENTFCITLAFAFSILDNFRLIPFLLFCFLFRALEVDGLWTKPLNVLCNLLCYVKLYWARSKRKK